MGILPLSPKLPDKLATSNAKRRSMQADFAKLKPLNPNGLMGFSKFRDPNERSETEGLKSKASKKRLNEEDSDEDVEVPKEVLTKTEPDDIQDANGMLSPEDARRQGELAEGVQKIRVCILQSLDQHPQALTVNLVKTTAFVGSDGLAFACACPQKVSAVQHTYSGFYSSSSAKCSAITHDAPTQYCL